MVFDYEVDESFEKVVTFVLGQAIDACDVVTDGKDRVPASDWVGPDDGVSCLKDHADVLWGSARAGKHFEVVGRRGLCKVRIGAVCSERTKIAAQRRRDTLVKFISRCPQSVLTKVSDCLSISIKISGGQLTASCLWQLCHPQ